MPKENSILSNRMRLLLLMEILKKNTDDDPQLTVSHPYEKESSNNIIFSIETEPDIEALVSFKYVIDNSIYIKNRD